MLIRPYDEAVDAALLRCCVVELQETERALDPRLPAGESMVDAYVVLMLRRCDDWDGRILVAYDEDDAALGMCCIYAHVPAAEPDEPSGTYALLNDLVVVPRARRQGVGRALLDAGEAYARERGAVVVRLEVMAGNEPALAVYQEAGYDARLVQLQKLLAP
jgi:ribosomal protein S18 acetylase RimI-like enzyme